MATEDRPQQTGKREQVHSNTKLNTGIAAAADQDHKREPTQWRTDKDMKMQKTKRDTTGEKDGLMKDRGTTTTVEKEHTDMKTATHQPMKIRDGANPRKEHMMTVKKGAADMTQAEDMNHPTHPHSGIVYTCDY